MNDLALVIGERLDGLYSRKLEPQTRPPNANEICDQEWYLEFVPEKHQHQNLRHRDHLLRAIDYYL